MMWDGKPYYDHPPMGFWLMAISYIVFGINEFSTRLPSAMLGLLTILLVYLLGKEWFGKKTIGFAAALVLGTSVWYVIRVRSGNLDSIFLFFYVLTIYLSQKASKNFKWFPLIGLSFGALILSKTLVGVSALVLILLLNIRQMMKVRKNFIYFVIAVILSWVVIYPWYHLQIKTYPEFTQHHFYDIGTRNKSFISYFHPILNPQMFFIHMGVRKWYYIWLAAIGFLLLTLKFIKRNVFVILVWNFVILYPFLTSQETQLWHLIPVYIPLAFISSVAVYEGIKMLNWLKKETITNFLYLSFFVVLAIIQVKVFYKEVYPAAKYTPDDVAISKAAIKYKKTIFLDDDFLPIAVFYSGKNVRALQYESDDKKTLIQLFNSDEKNFVAITRNWVSVQLDKANVKYNLLEKNNTYSLVSRP